jgi:hypothetical protein
MTVSTESGSGDRAESLGVRRPVELPETDMDAADGMAPADAEPEQEQDTVPAAEAETPAETAAQDKKDEDTAAAHEIAAPAKEGQVAGDGMPPDRPNKPVLAAVAIGGAVVLAIPLLLIGTGSHHHKKHPTVAAADTVLPGDGQPPAGAFTSASPTVTPTPSPSASAKKKVKPKKTANADAKKAKPRKKAVFTGVANVLLKNSASGLCADIPGYGKGSTDGPVAQYYCALGDADNQVWALGVMRDMKGPGGTALFLIRNTKDDYCMDLPGEGANGSGSKVSEYYCIPKHDNQLWYRQHTRGKLYRIRNYASHGLCLGPTGRSHARDKQLEIHKCGSGDEWSWPNGE